MFRCFFMNPAWFRWSILGSALIVFTTWVLTRIDVWINEWFGEFYNMIQKALGEPNSIAAEMYYSTLFEFLWIAALYIIIIIMLDFFTSHFVFRWRTAIHDRLTSNYHLIRHIEGASQRCQEDPQKAARIMEGLGSHFIKSVMVLFAFIPILWGLSEHLGDIPIIGNVLGNGGLVVIILCWCIGGTILTWFAGIKLPGLEYINQAKEAELRKILVWGEDDANAAEPATVAEIFSRVRKNYFNLFFSYLYFNFFRYGYMQFGVIFPYLILGPTIIGGLITLGVMQQILNAYGKVSDSLNFLFAIWPTLVEFLSVKKRIDEMEIVIREHEKSKQL